MPKRCNIEDDYAGVRLSKHFLLSDFMGCHSVYANGKSNTFVGGEAALAEARHLCEVLLEPMLEYGPISISYGYLSPALSRATVKYQDPNKPSYHRWDDGAAADVCVHNAVNKDDVSPAMLAHALDTLDGEFPYSRMITYSESPFICVASKLAEANSNGRRAFYENRYQGKKGVQPLFLRKSARPEKRAQELLDAQSTANNWRGEGYPTYHGGGRLQLQHRRASMYSMVSDFLYSKSAIDMPVSNMPVLPSMMPVFNRVGELYDTLLGELQVPRLSVAVGYQSRLVQYATPYGWEGGQFAIEFIPPIGTSLDDLASAAEVLDGIDYAYVTMYDTVYVKGEW